MEFKFGSVNKQVPWPEQSFNVEQSGGSQSPFEFLASPSSHLFLHSPVFKLPIFYFNFYFFQKRKEKKRKEKKRKERKKKKRKENRQG